MVFFKNATVDVAPPEGQFDIGPTVTRTVHIQPVSTQVAYDMFGVDVSNSFLLMDELDGDYVVHGRVFWENKEYVVAADPKSWSHGLPTDHIEVLLKEVRVLSADAITVLPR